MRIIVLLLLALPLVAAAQVRCPDGSYRDACPGGGGQALPGGNLSTYDGPSPSIQLNRLPSTRPESRTRYGEAGTSAGPRQPRSTGQRARSAGLTRNELVKARNRGIVLMGMGERDVVDIMGEPDRVDDVRGAGGSCRRLFWHHRYGVDVIRLCHNQVDYIDVTTR